jgi:predicted MPP superfamily phosphohydrolase
MKIIIIVFLVLSFGILIYARFLGTRPIKINEYKIKNIKLIDNLYGLKIVHITDIHYGRVIGERQFKKIVEITNELNPDIIVLTGDLLDRDRPLDKKNRDVLINLLNEFKSNLGNYIISGNHDLVHPYYYELIDGTIFKNVDDTFELVYHESNIPFAIVGLSSNLLNTTPIDEKLSSFLAFKEENETSFNILLLHEPDYIDEIDLSDFDIAFAGHSHHGQVRIPIIGALILPPKAQKYHDHFYLVDGFPLYISGGLGTSTIDLRLFNHPTINLYRFSNK